MPMTKILLSKGEKMTKLIGKTEIDNIRDGLKVALNKLRENYIPGLL